ncbi:Uncharacterised protein [Mycobacteroides abscessus subsp. abscessus]|nr:Uncharacterised protein [Mycobacteroides abscessus subsp. abscessus]
MMRTTSAAAAGTVASSPQYDPSASGIPTIITRDPVYMGWRTSPYNPVDVTVCPDSTVMLAAA